MIRRSDLELIAAVNRRDEDSFDVLYYRYRDWVVNLAFRFTGSNDLALDVLQETFLYFLKKFPGFTLTCQLKTFLYPAVRNLALAAKQKAARYQSLEATVDRLETPATETPPEPGSAREQFGSVLASLSVSHREVLRLRFLDGLSLNEIARALDIPLGTVKSRLHHALATLRQDPRTRDLLME